MAIDPEALRRLYVDEEHTAEEIAATFGCAATTIFRRLRLFGIRARPRGPRLPRKRRERIFSPLSWSASVAWAVGIIATDGNLCRDGRHLSVTSKDSDLLEWVRQALDVRPVPRPHQNGPGRICLRLQWSDCHRHAWLQEIGLTPAKSLTLGPLRIPDECFADFLRGCIDGDGSVLVYTDRYHTSKKANYVYERLYVSLVSASRPFVEWLRSTVERLTGIKGTIQCQRKERANPIWKLRYAKAESLAVLRWIYYAPDLPSLRRKRETAAPFLVRREPSPVRRTGRPMVI